MASPGFNLFQPQNQVAVAPGLFTPASSSSSVQSTLGPGQTAPGVVPPSQNQLPLGTGSPLDPSSIWGSAYNPSDPGGKLGGAIKQGGTGITTLSTLYPQFTGDFYDWLATQMGQGATPFNLSATLPSSGAATTPGSLSAPLTDTLSMLQNFYKTGTGGPTGASTLADMAATGAPTDVGPAWQAMVDAQQKNIQQNQAQLQEQFAKFGTLKGSPYGQASADYMEQTAKDQNALLAQMQQQASEAAAGRKLTAATDLTSGAQSLGQTLQGLDQQSITNLLQEFIRTRPEYSPLLNMMYGASTVFPPAFQTGTGAGIAASLVGGAGSLASTIAGLIPGL